MDVTLGSKVRLRCLAPPPPAAAGLWWSSLQALYKRSIGCGTVFAADYQASWWAAWRPAAWIADLQERRRSAEAQLFKPREQFSFPVHLLKTKLDAPVKLPDKTIRSASRCCVVGSRAQRGSTSLNQPNAGAT